ncbi:hypothetical protein [Streptomyces chrestomyceticus]|uniref:Uncharacterized protein n=1 Tax=Streptomyces chrestomyceticus TaxID=68185 RepID=A0ABU7WS32_9ACTN
MRVALVYPEVLDLARFKENRREFPPFAVLYLATVAERAGHEVTVSKVADGDHVRDFSGFEAVAFTIPSRLERRLGPVPHPSQQHALVGHRRAVRRSASRLRAACRHG